MYVPESFSFSSGDASDRFWDEKPLSTSFPRNSEPCSAFQMATARVGASNLQRYTASLMLELHRQGSVKFVRY